jgi:hypothetical protein
MTNPKNQNDEVKSLDEKINIEELLGDELEPEEAELLSAIEDDPEVQTAIEELLNNIDDLDIVQVQSKLLLLLHQIFQARIKDKEKFKAFIKKREKTINDYLKNISLYLLQTRSEIVRDASRNILTKEDKYEYLTKESRNNLRKSIKRFTVYEIYKFVNPRRIAGETRRDNFINNMIVGGLKRASRYEGGTKREIQTYSPKFIRNLEKQHRSFKRGGSSGMAL